MQNSRLYSTAPDGRYSAKKMRKPINFFCPAPAAKTVSVIGDFNAWDPQAHPMRLGPDGSWHLQVPLHHGHHAYVFWVDGVAQLDPRATGVLRDPRFGKVSLVSVS